MALLNGKKALIVGVANERSIAWGIAQRFRQEGADLAFTYLNEALEKRVRHLADSVGSSIVLPCDANDDAQIAETFRVLDQKWGALDVLVHAVAFALKEDLEGQYIATSRKGFLTALETSAYSLVALARPAAPLLERTGGGILTLTYYGSEKVIPNYNVMGVAKAALEASVRYLAEDLGPRGMRVNAISAGPIKTLAAKGIRGFNEMLHHVESKAPLRRNTAQEEVAGAALFLASGLSAGITGEVLYVDCGYHIKGM